MEKELTKVITNEEGKNIPVISNTPNTNVNTSVIIDLTFNRFFILSFILNLLIKV